MQYVSIHPVKALCLATLIFLSSCGGAPDEPSTPATSELQPDQLALPDMPVPPDNPFTPGKAALGKQLFFDTRLSATGEMACETCHVPELGWTDRLALSPRFDGSLNTRHSPTMINVGFYNEWYWDGRSATLESQVLAAWRGQMGAVPEEIAERLNAVEGYRNSFMAEFGEPANPDNISKALATFVRTITSDDSPWDRYERGDRAAVSADAIAGFEVFSEADKANCSLCHVPPLFTDTLFHNVGVGFGAPNPDLGRGQFLANRAEATGTPDPEAETLRGAFKTPTLRSVTETGPYFHDGSAETLEQAVDFMLNGGTPNPYLDQRLQPRQITAEERAQLLAFLRSLTPEPRPYERPQLP